MALTLDAPSCASDNGTLAAVAVVDLVAKERSNQNDGARRPTTLCPRSTNATGRRRKVVGAVYGFLGDRSSDAFAAMRESLSHRGRGGHREAIENAHASIGVMGRHARSLAFNPHAALAVVGELFDDHSGYRAWTLLDRYRQEGLRALEQLSGACSLIVVDLPTETSPARLTLLRDGSGARPLYFGAFDDRLLFGVEPKAVLAYPGFPRRLRMDAVAQYLSYSFQPGSGTMLEDLHSVGLGEWVRVTLSPGAAPSIERHRFFRFEDEGGEHAEEDATVDDATWVERTRSTVEKAVADRLPKADQPVSIFLSGGLDSSLVTAEVQRQRRRQSAAPPKTFAIHFGERYPNELAFAREVAAHVGTEHRDVEISPKRFLPRLRSIVHQLDDPIGDPITIPNFELAREVSGEADAVFNGEGGDPLFGGPKNLSMMLHHWYGLDDGPFAQERAYLRSYRRAYDERERLLTPEAWAKVDEHQALEAPLNAFFAAERPTSLLNKLMAINIRLKGAELILPKVDRMLGAHGIAVRAPLFDARLIRLSFAMPPRMKLRDGIEKWALKQAFADALPRSIVDRPKSGMRVPVHFWFQGELRRYGKKILSKREIERVGIFRADRVKQLLAYDTEEGRGRYGIKLWMLLNFELWRRMVVDGERP